MKIKGIKMTHFTKRILVFALAIFLSFSLFGQINQTEIDKLNKALAESSKSKSNARKKLAIRRVIREAQALFKENVSAENRFDVLNVIFKSQQALFNIDKTSSNKKALLETCNKLIKAPAKYAALRLDADLLLTQVEVARKGGGAAARANALRPLVDRYKNTDVEPKVLRVAMFMAFEYGDTKLINDLHHIISERFPDDLSLIKFQREKLTTHVFGVPFIANLERSDGKFWDRDIIKSIKIF